MTAIVVPAYGGYTKKTKEEVCKANCVQVERDYESYMVLENIEHSDAIFQQFLKEYVKSICPEHGEINYVNGKVRCSAHAKDVGEDDDVPFLD